MVAPERRHLLVATLSRATHGKMDLDGPALSSLTGRWHGGRSVAVPVALYQGLCWTSCSTKVTPSDTAGERQMSIGVPPAPVQFDERLRTASRFLRAPAERLISIKARPIRAVGGYATDYMSQSDYDIINAAFNDPTIKLVKDAKWACNGKTRVYELDGGVKIVYVEHESGPEIIFHDIILVSGAIGSTAFAANQLLNLFNKLCKMVQGRHSRRDAKGRFAPVSAEKRTKGAQQLIRQIGKTARSVGKAVKSIEDLSDT
jgi:hypothetical protein